ncbi:MAG TPA: cysteine desulfurase family protein, partial [Dongiaceae bacterium]|nr:cysteine desulfurase family protein [Dongiaceae bacterium]
RRARRILDRARSRVARFVAADPDEVIFTASATEANNLAILGTLAAHPARRRVVTTAFEHPSVGAVLDQLEARGCTIVRVRPDRDGVVDPAAVIDAATAEPTALVSVMLAQHEVGTLQPVHAIGPALRARGVPFHTDATQAAGALPIGLDRLDADLVTFSGHKIGAPHGAGVLLARRGFDPAPILQGGGQENGRRPGTENVAAIAGLGAVAELLTTTLAAEAATIARNRDRLETAVDRDLADVEVHGARVARLPGTSSLHVRGAEAEALVIGCDLEGFAVSAGAACSSGTPGRSPALLAMGLADAAGSTLRVGLGWSTTDDTVDRFLIALAGVVARARAAAPTTAARS